MERVRVRLGHAPHPLSTQPTDDTRPFRHGRARLDWCSIGSKVAEVWDLADVQELLSRVGPEPFVSLFQIASPQHVRVKVHESGVFLRCHSETISNKAGGGRCYGELRKCKESVVMTAGGAKVARKNRRPVFVLRNRTACGSSDLPTERTTETYYTASFRRRFRLHCTIQKRQLNSSSLETLFGTPCHPPSIPSHPNLPTSPSQAGIPLSSNAIDLGQITNPVFLIPPITVTPSSESLSTVEMLPVKLFENITMLALCFVKPGRGSFSRLMRVTVMAAYLLVQGWR